LSAPDMIARPWVQDVLQTERERTSAVPARRGRKGYVFGGSRCRDAVKRIWRE
jgi:hypothetical protein